MITDFQRKLQKVSASLMRLPSVIEESTIDTLQEKEIGAKAADMNTGQLWAGIDSESRNITPSYAASTIAYKRRNKQPTGRVTLKDTGDFYDNLMPEPIDDGIELTSDLPYTPFLVGGYGRNIFGLTKQNISKLSTIIAPIIRKKVTEFWKFLQ
jgi:hypothetical protein